MTAKVTAGIAHRACAQSLGIVYCVMVDRFCPFLMRKRSAVRAGNALKTSMLTNKFVGFKGKPDKARNMPEKNLSGGRYGNRLINRHIQWTIFTKPLVFIIVYIVSAP